MKRLVTVLLLVLLMIVGTISCTQPRSHVSTADTYQPRQEYFYHTVKYSGETLGLIARWYTGNTNNWQRILEDNPGLRPERINLGDVIRIPDFLVIERSSMPQRFIPGSRAATSGTTQTVPPVTRAPVKEKVEDPLQIEPEVPTDIYQQVEEYEPVDDFEPVEPEAAPVVPEAPAAPSIDPDELERERLLEELLGE